MNAFQTAVLTGWRVFFPSEPHHYMAIHNPKDKYFCPQLTPLLRWTQPTAFIFLFGRNSPKHNHTCASFPFSVIASLCSWLAFNMTRALGWLQTHWIPSIPSLASRPRLSFTYTPRPLGTHCWSRSECFQTKAKIQTDSAQIPFKLRASHSSPWQLITYEPKLQTVN